MCDERLFVLEFIVLNPKYLITTTYLVRGKVMFSLVFVCSEGGDIQSRSFLAITREVKGIPWPGNPIPLSRSGLTRIG